MERPQEQQTHLLARQTERIPYFLQLHPLVVAVVVVLMVRAILVVVALVVAWV
jgi:hypothetical protein